MKLAPRASSGTPVLRPAGHHQRGHRVCAVLQLPVHEGGPDRERRRAAADVAGGPNLPSAVEGARALFVTKAVWAQGFRVQTPQNIVKHHPRRYKKRRKPESKPSKSIITP